MRRSGALGVLSIPEPSQQQFVESGRAFQRIWWQKPAEGISTKASGDRLLAPAILVTLILVLGIWAQPLVAAAQLT